MAENDKRNHEDRTGMLIGGSIVLGVGALFLLVNMDILPPLDDSWPFFLIIVGLALIIGGLFKKSKQKIID